MPYTDTPMPAALASGFPVLVVAARVEDDSAIGRSVEEIRAALEALGRRVVLTHSLDDAEAAVEAHPALSCVVLGWGMAAASEESLAQTKRILARIRQQVDAPGVAPQL